MLNVGIIGIGNAGNQVAALAKERLQIPVIAINSTEKDLETIPDSITKILITNPEAKTQHGSGKDRKLAKEYLKSSIVNIVSSDDVKSFLQDLDEVFVISSTGGGTGSGTAPLMCNILTEAFADVHPILIGITPVNDDAYSSHVNTLAYLKELYDVLGKATYMLYDNDKLAGKPSYQLLQEINEEIVKDIDVLRCTYNHTTRFDSIDDRDMERLLQFPGRIMVTRVEGIKEKDLDSMSIDDMIINNIKTNCHVEHQRDHKIMATGVISNLSKTINDQFDNNLVKVREFVGEPVHAFNHIAINDERSEENRVFFIMTGLTPVNDKINKINDRIDEIDEAQKVVSEGLVLNEDKMEELTAKITDEKVEHTSKKVDLADIFSKFE